MSWLDGGETVLGIGRVAVIGSMLTTTRLE